MQGCGRALLEDVAKLEKDSEKPPPAALNLEPTAVSTGCNACAQVAFLWRLLLLMPSIPSVRPKKTECSFSPGPIAISDLPKISASAPLHSTLCLDCS